MKNKILTVFVFAFCFATIFSSCSIEKRHYTRGFHIEWRSSHHTSNKAAEPDAVSEEKGSSSNTIEESHPEVLSDSIVIENLISDNSAADQVPVEQAQPKVNNRKVKEKSTEQVSGIDEIHEKVFTDAKTDPVAIFSLIFVVAGLLIALLFTGAPAFIGFTLPFLGFIFGIISACRIAMNPKKNKGMALALIGTVSALIVLTIVLLMFLI